MATKVKTGVIDSGAITSALITDASITADDLHTTLDLTGKNVTVATASASDNDTSVASTAYVTTAIANLADSAPSTLNTLNELAAALGDDENFSTTVTNSIATKAPLASPSFTGNVGIGTSAPDLRLHVDGSNGYPATSGTTPNGMLHLRSKTSGASHGFYMGVGNAAPWGSWLQSADAGNLATNYPLLLNPNGGNVGIGATAPSQKLEVDGDVRIKDARSLFFNRNGDNYAWRIRNESAQDSTTYGFDGGNDLVFEVVSNSQVSAAPSATSHNIYSNSGNTLVLKETGYVGIGTQTPRTKLDVRGEISVDYNATYGLRFYNQPGNNWSSIGNTKTNSSANMVFKDSTGQVMELADGKIYLGTASNGSGVGVNAQNWIHANGLNLDIKGNDDVRFLGDAGSVIGRFTYQSRLAVGANAPVVPLDIQSSTFGLPNTSGTTANGMVRIGYGDRTWSGNEVMLGIINASSNNYAGYIQSKVPTDQSAARPFLINPQGGGVGIGLDQIYTGLDVATSNNSFVSVGIAPLAVGQYAGIHFGYKENNTSYRKSAIVFKRTDKTANDAQGQMHFLNGPQNSGGSATLSDSKMIIHEGGQVTTGKNPAFRAYLSTERTTNGDFTSGWTDSGANSGVNAYDVNNDFNISNGRFTAPVSGTYHFDLMWDSNASDAQINMFVVGTGHTGYLVRWEPTGAANQGWESRAYSTDAYLEEGDYLYLVGMGASGTHPFHMGSAYWGFFSGHLVG